MARRPKAVQSWVSPDTAADTLVKNNPGIVYSISLSWTGQNVGDRVIIFDNSTDTGTKVWEGVLSTTAGQWSPQLPEVGLECLTGIYFDFQVGDLTKIKVSLGYD